ncbi:MAG TPA: CapA family protein, partial [Candidatus Limnocylindria bacterium]|nr:CapA family protein [Candidatus Limnocylindria bacterium]
TTYWARNEESVRATFEALREEGCDAIVAVMHGGTEYAPRRWKDQERMAAWAIRQGADLVIGHHPHVVQGMDVLDGVSVVYSLGNFAFGGNKDVRAAHALIARAELHFGADGEYLGHRLNLIPVAPSGEKDFNNYQPVFLGGAEADKAIALAQRDTPFPLSPFAEGEGAWQPFVPAVGRGE